MSVNNKVIGFSEWQNMIVTENRAAFAVLAVKITVKIIIGVLQSFSHNYGIIYKVTRLYPAYKIVVFGVKVNKFIEYIGLLLLYFLNLLLIYLEVSRCVHFFYVNYLVVHFVIRLTVGEVGKDIYSAAHKH